MPFVTNISTFLHIKSTSILSGDRTDNLRACSQKLSYNPTRAEKVRSYYIVGALYENRYFILSLLRSIVYNNKFPRDKMVYIKIFTTV